MCFYFLVYFTLVKIWKCGKLKKENQRLDSEEEEESWTLVDGIAKVKMPRNKNRKR